MATRRRLSNGDYSVGWICALPCELEAARRALDKTHYHELELAECDENTYTYGEIHGHNVVIACLPSGVYGTTSATVAAQHMNASFRSLRYRFMVGVGGGVPSRSNDIRLGDIVVSKPEGKEPGVIQYDLGKTLPLGQFQEAGSLNKPPRALLTAIPVLQTDPSFSRRLAATIAVILTNGDLIQSPGFLSDRLFSSSYTHPESKLTCDECDQQWLVQRERRPTETPHVHYGLIASGNQVVKDAVERDKLVRSRNILCFEMEAAGLMDDFGCMVVRGICDYSDSHKNEAWQPYAAATAAAYVKTLLEAVRQRKGKQTPQEHLQIPPDLKDSLCRLFVTDPNENRRSLMARRGRPTENTCQWIFKTDELTKWLDVKATDSRPADSVFWLHGLPGSGKSTMAMCLTEGLEQHFEDNEKESFTYFFCEANRDTQNTATSILRGILWQLIRQNPILGDSLVMRFRERQDTLLTSFDALWTLFTEIVLDPRCEVSFCIIDALDECDSESLMLFLKQVKLSFFDRPSSQFTSKVRILITSRPYKEIAMYLAVFPSRDLSTFEEGKEDIEIFIEQKVGDLSMCKSYPDSMKSMIRDILKRKAEGTFLWIGLTCNELMNVDMQDTLPFLESLAPGLNTLYTKLVEKAVENEQKRDKIYSILAVVAVSRQALTLFQLCMACGLYIEEEEDMRVAFAREDIRLCRLMVVEKDGLVHLLHKSVQDFLFRSDLTQFPTREESHAQLAHSCLNYTAKHFQKPFGDLEKLLNERRYQVTRLPSLKDLDDQINQIYSTWNAFIPYCSQYWMDHAHLAGSRFDIKKITEAYFLTLDSSSRERWLQYYRIEIQKLPEQMGILHIAAWWGIPELIKFTLGEKSATGDKFYVDTEFLTIDITTFTPLELAAIGGYLEVFSTLVSRSNPTAMIRGSILTAALQRNANCASFIDNVLQDLGHRIVVTEDLEIAAAANVGDGPEILKLLLAHRDRQFHVSEPYVSMPVLIKAAGNEGKGKQIMELLFEYLKHEVTVTEELLRVAAHNTKCALALLEMLLDHWKGKDIPESVVAAAALNRTEGPLVIQLLQRRATKAIHITDSIFSSACKNIETGISCLEQLWKEELPPTTVGERAIHVNSGGDAYDLVLCWALSQPCNRVVFSKDATKAIFAYRRVTAIAKVLSLYEEGLQLPEEWLMAAASNYHGASIFTFLFMSYSQQVEMTDRIVVYAVCSRQTLKIIMAHRPADQCVVNHVAITKALNLTHKPPGVLLPPSKDKTKLIHIDGYIMKQTLYRERFIDNVVDHPSVTYSIDKTMLVALNTWGGKYHLMGRLLALPEGRVEVSKEAVLDIVQEYGRKNTELLLHRKDNSITDQAVERVVQYHDADILSLLLDGQNIKMTKDIERAASLNDHGPRILPILIKGTEGNFSSNEHIMETVVSGCEQHIVKQYFQRLPPDTWTRKTISILVSCQCKSKSIQSLVQLLLQCHQGVWIDRQVVEEIVESCHASVVKAALQRSDLSKYDILVAALNNTHYGGEVIKLLVGDGRPKCDIDTELMYGMARVSDHETMADMIRRGLHAPWNFNMFLLLWAAAENPSSGDRITESLLSTNGADTGENHLMTHQSSSRWSKPHQSPLPITQILIDAASENQALRHKIIQIFLEEPPDKICVTRSGLREIIKNFGIGFIHDVMLDGNFHADIDHLMIEAGVGNQLDGPRVLEFLLSQMTTQVEITAQTVTIALGNVSHRPALMCQLISNEKISFGQAAVIEVIKSMDSIIITDLILSPARNPQVDEVCVLEAIAAQRDSPTHIITLFHLLKSLGQPVTITSSIIKRLYWCNFDLQMINELLNTENIGVSVTATAMVEFIHLYSGSLQPLATRYRKQSGHWRDILVAYRRQLGNQGAIDEEVLVALLHAVDDNQYLADCFTYGFCFSGPVVEDMILPIAKGIIPGLHLTSFIASRFLDTHPPAAMTTGGTMCILEAKNDVAEMLIPQIIRERFGMCQEVAIKLAAVANEADMGIIFDQRDECIRVTEDMLFAAASNQQHKLKVLNYLLGLFPTSITHELIIRVLEDDTPEAMSIFRSLVKFFVTKIDITEDLLIAVVENIHHKESDLTMLLKTHSAPSCLKPHIYEAFLIKAIKDRYSGPTVLRMLEVWDPLPITEEILVLAQVIRYKWADDLFGKYAADLLTRKRTDRKPPSIEFLQAAFLTFKPTTLALIIDLYKDLIDINSELVSYTLGRVDFEEVQDVLTARGLVSAVYGSTLYTLSDKPVHSYEETAPKMSILGNSDALLNEICLTEEMVHKHVPTSRDDSQADLVQSYLSQRARTVIVAHEAILAIFKYHDLATIKTLLSGQANIVIPSMLVSSLQSIRVEDTKRAPFRSRWQIDITEEIICATIQNSSDQSLAILRFLFTHFGCLNIISRKVLVAAASADHQSTKVLELLLCCSQGKTEDVEPIAVAAAGNQTYGDHLLAILFDHFGDAVQPSEHVLTAAVKNQGTKHVLLQCLSRLNCRVTPKVLAAAARNPVFAVEMMKTLLEKFQTPITETVLIEAACNEDLGDRLLDLFLEKRGSEVRLTEKVIKGFLGRKQYYHKLTGHCRVPETALDSSFYLDPYSIQIAAILSRSLSRSQFKIFLSKYQPANPQDLALELAQECNDVTLRMFLEQYNSEICLSEDLLKRAARNTHWRTKILEVFVFCGEGSGQVVAVTPGLVAAAAENKTYGYNFVQLLRTRRSEAPFVDSKALLAAASNPGEFSLRLLKLLFRCSQDSLPITTELLSAAAENPTHGTEMLRLLLSRLEKQGDDQILFEDVLKGAAANTADQVREYFNYFWNSPLGLLIRKKRDRINITEGVLVAAAANTQNGKSCVLLLLKYAEGKSIITENVLCAAARNPKQGHDILIALVNHPSYQKVAISDYVLVSGVMNDGPVEWDKVVKLLLSHHGAPMPVTERVILAAVESDYHSSEKIEMLLEQYQGPICILGSTLQEVSQKLEGSTFRKLQARQTHSQASERTNWYVVWRLFIQFASYYYLSFSLRGSK
ncbi:hypothetical protein BDV25DRAFT_138323 [Aspergillus avenaceus]|uniref:NACHT domain-containing protein n=1 Tax=Aspergillus avenaceus TaxID=36643 RepID=A0A5N6U0S3_ASPAV|nr:hypothetical protein BDV25DRAFT_138323 [Aspergillus avenaceus]